MNWINEFLDEFVGGGGKNWDVSEAEDGVVLDNDYITINQNDALMGSVLLLTDWCMCGRTNGLGPSSVLH